MLAILVRYAWSFCQYSMWLLGFFFSLWNLLLQTTIKKKTTYIGEIVSKDHSPSDRWWWKFVPFLWCWRLYCLVLALDVTFNASLSEVAAIHFLSPLFSTQGHTVLGSVSGRRWSSTIDCMWMDEVIGMLLVCDYQEASPRDWFHGQHLLDSPVGFETPRFIFGSVGGTRGDQWLSCECSVRPHVRPLADKPTALRY